MSSEFFVVEFFDIGNILVLNIHMIKLLTVKITSVLKLKLIKGLVICEN